MCRQPPRKKPPVPSKTKQNTHTNNIKTIRASRPVTTTFCNIAISKQDARRSNAVHIPGPNASAPLHFLVTTASIAALKPGVPDECSGQRQPSDPKIRRPELDVRSGVVRPRGLSYGAHSVGGHDAASAPVRTFHAEVRVSQRVAERSAQRRGHSMAAHRSTRVGDRRGRVGVCVCGGEGGGGHENRSGSSTKPSKSKHFPFLSTQSPGARVVQGRLWRVKGGTGTTSPSLTKCILVVTAQRKTAVFVTRAQREPSTEQRFTAVKDMPSQKACFGRVSSGGAFST